MNMFRFLCPSNACSRTGLIGPALALAFALPWTAVQAELLISGSCLDFTIDDEPLSSFHQGQSRPVTAGGGRPTGPIQFEEVRVVKPLTASSVQVSRAIALNALCPSINIRELSNDISRPVLRWQLILTNASLTGRKNWRIDGAEGPQDAWSMVAEQYEWQFVDEGGTVISFCWNLETVGDC